MQVERRALVRDRTRRLNRLKTQTLAQIERRIAVVQAGIETRLRARRARPLSILRSIPGIGPVAAAGLLIECPEIGTLGRKRIASLAGLAPRARQPGRRQGQAFIQGGRKPLRDALYMPAGVAIRFSPNMQAKSETMRTAGKPAKVAIAAIMGKLPERADALLEADREWAPEPA